MCKKILNWWRIWSLRLRGVRIGSNVKIFNFCNLYDCEIGDNVLIGSYVTIQAGAVIKSNCRIGDYCFIPSGTVIEENVFLAQHVSVTNDKYPKSHNKNWKLEPVIIKRGASIGAGVALLPGVVIGENALIGAGSVVTRSVPSDQVWCGNPAMFLKNNHL